MNPSSSLHFVYRSQRDGPLARRVVRLPDASVLAWFQRGWREAEDPAAWVAAECGGPVAALDSVLVEARRRSLPCPASEAELGQLLGAHLYFPIEGCPTEIHFDGRSLRVATSNSQPDVAFYLLDEATVRERPDRVAWLLHADPALPPGGADAPYVLPADVQVQRTRPTSTPAYPARESAFTCAVLLTPHSNASFEHPRTVIFPGLRLPDLPTWLRSTLPAVRYRHDHFHQPADRIESWPAEILLLRAMLDPGDTDLLPALRRCNEYPSHSFCGRDTYRQSQDEGVAPHAVARAALEALRPSLTPLDSDPERSIVGAHEHVAWLWKHLTDEVGYEQWIFFDDAWAAAHPDLASSLLRYATRWDPLADGPPVRELVAPPPTTPEEDEASRARRLDRIATRELPPDVLARWAWDPDTAIRAAVASVPTPAETAVVLARDADLGVRRALASNVEASPDAHRLLATDPDVTVRRAVADNAYSDEVLVVLARDPDVQIRRLVAAKGFGPEEAVALLARDPDPGVRAVCAATDPADLAELARSADPELPGLVAANPAAPPEALAWLAENGTEEVRRTLALNPATPPAVLASLAAHESEPLREALARHAATPPDVMARLAREGSRSVRWNLACNPAVPAGILDLLIDGPDLGSLAVALAGHPNLPLHVLEPLVTHPEAWLRSAVVANPRLPLPPAGGARGGSRPRREPQGEQGARPAQADAAGRGRRSERMRRGRS